jgi:hypothetical protein
VAERRAIAVAGVWGSGIQDTALSGAGLDDVQGYSMVLVKCAEASDDWQATGRSLGGGNGIQRRGAGPREMMR